MRLWLHVVAVNQGDGGKRRVGFNCNQRGEKKKSFLSCPLHLSLSGFWLSSTLTQISERGDPSIGLVVVLMRRLMSFVGKVLIQSQDRVFLFFFPHSSAQGAVMNFAAEYQDG